MRCVKASSLLLGFAGVLVSLGSLVECRFATTNLITDMPAVDLATRPSSYVYIVRSNGTFEADDQLTTESPVCPPKSSIDEFPEDMFTNEQRTHGAILLHIFAAIYFFTLLAVVCNDYFLPSVECICDDLNISKDVAAATFMATATTTPELFTNVISTFVIDSDLGVGAIIGSLLFNTLGVAAVAGMASRTPVQLERWPITRDCILFCVNLAFLIWFAWDGRITLVESIVLVALYFVYFVVLFNNKNMVRLYERMRGIPNGGEADDSAAAMPTKRSSYDLPTPIDFVPSTGTYRISKHSAEDLRVPTISGDALATVPTPVIVVNKSLSSDDGSLGKLKARKTLWAMPEGSLLRTIWWAYTWPIKCLLTLCIPNPKTWRRLYPVTFVMCVLFIGMNSYMIVWMITLMGHTFRVPESVMGLTFLAAGGCMPEAISSVLMVRKGEGGIGVSNSLGANSLAILMSLGMPWLIRNIIHRNDPHMSFIQLDSVDIEYTIISLLVATVALYAVIWMAKYTLKRSVGFTLIVVYLVFITLCILLEMDILFPTNGCR